MDHYLNVLRYKLRNFHRKVWMSVLRFASNRLSTKDVMLVLDEIWQEMVRQRIASFSRTPEGIETARMIFFGHDGDAMDTSLRDMRDYPRDMRDDRAS